MWFLSEELGSDLNPSEAKLSLMASRGFLLVLVPSVDGKCGLL